MRHVFSPGRNRHRAFQPGASLHRAPGLPRFWKRSSPAGLNFGDCFAYALAKVTGEPLLFKGKDFKKTDIVSAL